MNPTRTSRRVVLILLLVVCCVLTCLATRLYVYRSLMFDYGTSLQLDAYRPAFEDFLHSREMADAEQVNGENLPGPLADLGVINVYRNGRFVYFVVKSDCFIGDCVTSEFIWQLDNGAPAIEEILKTTRRKTYHVLHYSSARRWYFWEHD